MPPVRPTNYVSQFLPQHHGLTGVLAAAAAFALGYLAARKTWYAEGYADGLQRRPSDDGDRQLHVV